MDADGSNQTRLTFRPGRDANPGWSPSGQQIVFHRETPGAIFQVFIINADGTGVIQVTTLPTTGFFPSWHTGLIPPSE